MQRPPRVARLILERALPEDVREAVSGDLHELFARRRQAAGRARAYLWYWRQAASFSAKFLAERVRDRRRETDMSSPFSWLDVKLALRMLVRHPGLTIVGVAGMAVGITISAAAFGIISVLLDPSLPLEDGDRIVALQNWDLSTNNADGRVLRDFAGWREQLRSVEDVGVFRTVGRNLIAPGAQPETVAVAEMSAAGFRVARVSPLLGRYLLPEDERAEAAPVLVIGHDVWRRRFAGDPMIVGREVQLGDTVHAVVGVMPEGFAFPVNHSFWIPWRLDPAAFAARGGPPVSVFARLAPGQSLQGAQAELAAIGQRAATAMPGTHEHLRPRVLPYTYPFSDMDDPDTALELQVVQSVIVMLLAVVCVNVAILVYARTATRQGEIAVRSALGASRGRIVTQLFIEALVLSGAAAVVGIGLLAVASRQGGAALDQLGATLPFWMDFSLSPVTVMYVVALAVLSAAIVGVVPALKATGRAVQTGLKGLSSGSGSRMQMGRMWTLLIVAQVAIAVALLPVTVYHTWSALRLRAGDLGFATQEFLTTELVLEASGDRAASAEAQRAFTERYATRTTDLLRRLEADPAVADATFSMVNPGQEWAVVLEVEGMPPPERTVDYNIVEGTKTGHLVRFNRIAADFLQAYDVPLLMGRALRPGDSAPGAERILVNRAFVHRLLADGNALGRRVRYVGRSREASARQVALGRWFEIVGVVPDFPAYAMGVDDSDARVYHLAAPGDVSPATLAVRVRGTDPLTFAGRLRELCAAVDPNLQLRDLSSVDAAVRRDQGVMRLVAATLGAVTLSVIGLSAAGIYALMSFTVERRRKEIGIRAALGAEPTRILRSIFSRAFGQLAVGAALGMAGAFTVEQVAEPDMLGGQGAVILPLVAVLMTVVGLLAAIGPARRGLGIQPIDALREE